MLCGASRGSQFAVRYNWNVGTKANGVNSRLPTRLEIGGREKRVLRRQTTGLCIHELEGWAPALSQLTDGHAEAVPSTLKGFHAAIRQLRQPAVTPQEGNVTCLGRVPVVRKGMKKGRCCKQLEKLILRLPIRCPAGLCNRTR